MPVGELEKLYKRYWMHLELSSSQDITAKHRELTDRCCKHIESKEPRKVHRSKTGRARVILAVKKRIP